MPPPATENGRRRDLRIGVDQMPPLRGFQQFEAYQEPPARATRSQRKGTLVWLFVPPKDMTTFAASAFAPVSEDWISDFTSLNPDIELCVMSSETVSPRPLSWPGWQTRPWLRLLCGTISNPLMADRGAAAFISSLPVIPASPSPCPAPERDKTTRATCGQTLPESSGKSTPSGVSSRMFRATSPLASRTSPETFRKWATGLQRASYQRRKSAGLTYANGCSFWPTPTFKMGGNRTSIRVSPGRFQFVVDANQKGSQVGLKVAASTWMVMWDLWKATGWTPGPLVSSPRCQVTLLPGDKHSKGKAVLQLNPSFTDWMMGWPSRWTDPLQPVTGWSPWLRRARGGF